MNITTTNAFPLHSMEPKILEPNTPHSRELGFDHFTTTLDFLWRVWVRFEEAERTGHRACRKRQD